MLLEDPAFARQPLHPHKSSMESEQLFLIARGMEFRIAANYTGTYITLEYNQTAWDDLQIATIHCVEQRVDLKMGRI